MKKEKGKNSGGLVPNSLRIISSCIKTVSTNASTVVRSISASGDDRKDQVTWVGFDKLDLGSTAFRHVLLLGYQTGFQVIDVEDASNFTELVSKHDGPATFLQMLPIPAKSDGNENIRLSHPLLLVVAGDEATRSSVVPSRNHMGVPGMDSTSTSQAGSFSNYPTAVRFYSFQSNCYVKVLRFRSTVLMVRCSPLIVAVGLENQIRCIDALTLEDKFSVPTYPVPRFGGQGAVGVNIAYGPMAVGPRWLAYSSSSMLVPNTGRLSPKNLGPGISLSTSPSSSTLMARYAMESSKQLAAGIMNLGDKGYKTISKYCPDLLDGPSSPVPLKSGWKGIADPETDKAGLVVVKDVISEAVISQFKAHTSAICALCFDPSGTLLVTASIHGNNINIFRIMPSCTQSGLSSRSHDWGSSHVHLYKLHRGVTTAIIQDISFSRYSQWISIVSSKGTCHIFVLSPFGGDAGHGTRSFHDLALYPAVTLPWWFTSSFVLNQQPSPPPPPVTLSVVSRIKNNSSGLFNSVGSAASSTAGKTHMPSGALAAVFHNSMPSNFQDFHKKGRSLEHLLVYSPSGYVIQHELLPSSGVQQIDSGSRAHSGSYASIQDEDFRVIVEPLQWWDVCRRSDSPEREGYISNSTSDGQEPANVTGGQNLVKSDLVKRDERSNLFISNAEVQINSGRSLVWQKSKVRFDMMSSPKGEGYAGGEFEIEKVPSHEVEIRRKDLLPVFDHFHNTKSDWIDRDVEGYLGASSLEPRQDRDKATGETVYCHSKPASLSSTSSDGGSSRRIDNFPDLDQVSNEKSSIFTGYTLNELYQERRGSTSIEASGLNQKLIRMNSSPYERSNNAPSYADNRIVDSFSTLEIGRRVLSEGAPSSNTGGISQAPVSTPDHFNSEPNILMEQPTLSEVKKPEDFAPDFEEGYCKAVTDDGVIENSNNPCERENSENDGEDVELLGGMFDPF